LRSDFFSAFDGNGKYQLLFAIGHEFSHYLLGHLEKDREIEDEFECDKESIIRPHYPCEEYD
jgi:hypothetical protein